MTTTADPVKETQGYNVVDFIDARQLKTDLAYSSNNLSTAMSDQASLFAHYGTLAANASRQVDVIKLLLENTEAAVYKILRDKAAADGEKLTENQLEKMITRHARVIAMKRSLNEAKRIEAICKTAVESFRHRRDMLVQEGLISREEMKGNIRIAEKTAHEEAMEERRRRVLENRRAPQE